MKYILCKIFVARARGNFLRTISQKTGKAIHHMVDVVDDVYDVM
jgi:hypothetical protein